MPNIVPKILAKGTIDKGSVAMNYFVMSKLDVDMNTYLESFTGVQFA